MLQVTLSILKYQQQGNGVLEALLHAPHCVRAGMRAQWRADQHTLHMMRA